MGLFDFGQFFGRRVRNPEEAAKAAEEAEVSIEQRMARISNRLKKGGYDKLADQELHEILADIEKILEFVHHAVAVIESRSEIPAARALKRRLVNVQTRANKILKRRQETMRQAGAA